MIWLDQFRWVCALAMAMALGSLTLSGYGEDVMHHKNQQVVRRTHGDGRWFPGDKDGLRKAINEYIGAAQVSPIKGRIIGAISPHAGYVYSGPVAGYVFRVIKEQVAKGEAPDTVVILGLCHQGGCRGVALMDGDAVRSPLGEIALDKDAAALLTSNRPSIFLDYAPHKGEHSAENQIPFVQAVLPNARLVVGLIGDHNPKTLDDLGAGLVELAKKRKLLVIASSDLLHDPDYSRVTRTDQASLKDVVAMNTRELLERWSYENQIFCGIAAVVATMRFVEKQGCREGILLRYRNSGDDHPESRGNWVVGYSAVVFPSAGIPVTK